MANTECIPGVCNLGRAEFVHGGLPRGLVSHRPWLPAGVFAGCGSLVSQSADFRPGQPWRGGLLQTLSGFCVKFDFQGVFNFGPDVGKTDTVEQAEFRKKDKQKAIQISLTGLMLAAA